MPTAIIDAIRKELRRQAKGNPDLMVQSCDKPDCLRVLGIVDLYELAKAIEQR